MSRLTVDPELLLVGLLTAALPAVNVMAAPDVDAASDLPLLIVSPNQGAMVSNGAPGLGWEWIIDFTVLQHGHQAASDLADSVYQTIHGFDDHQSALTGVGHVCSTSDEQMFHRVATVIQVDNLTQYSGSFRIILRPAS